MKGVSMEGYNGTLNLLVRTETVSMSPHISQPLLGHTPLTKVALEESSVELVQ